MLSFYTLLSSQSPPVRFYLTPRPFVPSSALTISWKQQVVNKRSRYKRLRFDNDNFPVVRYVDGVIAHIRVTECCGKESFLPRSFLVFDSARTGTASSDCVTPGTDNSDDDAIPLAQAAPVLITLLWRDHGRHLGAVRTAMEPQPHHVTTLSHH